MRSLSASRTTVAGRIFSCFLAAIKIAPSNSKVRAVPSGIGEPQPTVDSSRGPHLRAERLDSLSSKEAAETLKGFAS